MEQGIFHHALKINNELCYGCTHCMNACPTEAIRIKNGKAVIYEHKCIDCGMCFKACPVDAIEVEQDDFSTIFEYKHRVALYPSILTGQFPSNYRSSKIASTLLDLGFTNAYEVEHAADLLKLELQKYQKKNKQNTPLISSFCPAIIRLIQVKFPSLAGQIIQLKPPIDIAAEYYRKKLKNEGAKDNEIGLFYITPCAAKIAAIKSPVGESKSLINGVINLDFIYNRIYRTLKQGRDSSKKCTDSPKLTGEAVLWSLTNGEANNALGRTIAIDGVHNAIEFLGKLENQEITGIDFVEIRACDESCAGGILNSTNRFLSVERLNNRAKKYYNKNIDETQNLIFSEAEYLRKQITIAPVKPRSMLKLDEDMAQALLKIEKSRRIMCFLPGIDCGACGAPNCQALAEDIVKHKANLSNCVFLQAQMQKTGKMSGERAYKSIEKIWGNQKLVKNCNKKGAIDESSN